MKLGNMAEENQNEEPVFKVADKRKFNLDGSLREGAAVEEPKPQAPAAAVAQTDFEDERATREIERGEFLKNQREENVDAPANLPTDLSAEAGDNLLAADETALGDDDFDESQIPGADNPASFANFVLSLASQAAAALGMSENPTTGQIRVDLQSGKYLIDVLGMLKDKTVGNLHPLEDKLFGQLLGELRMQFVQIERLANEQRRKQEDQLMKQAAQKFTGKDILGK